MTNVQKLTNKQFTINEFYRNMDSFYLKHVHADFTDINKRIKENIHLNTDQRKRTLEEAQKVYTVRAMAFMREFKGTYDAACENLKQEARTELANLEPATVDESTRKIFEKDLKAVERKLLLSTDNRSRAKHLDELMKITTEPALAEKSLEVFLRYAAQDMQNLTGSTGMRFALLDKLKKLERLATPQGEDTLREIIEDCEHRQAQGIVVSRNMHNALSSVSREAMAFSHNPEKYFIKCAEDVARVIRDHGNEATYAPVSKDYEQLETHFLQQDIGE
ncbi:hypothetical protein AT257_16210 [Bacillus cereus]|uniref:hypothetical protein n=1 Tax=Bacillus mycoides TaxID=1405 RepID=UPI00077AC491|nr:hypothetical protein [Bacillus mycoides]KXY44790.1 hypothetical protein AT257_16210 [Bacillus cereus]MCZ6940533.1 hypothetical protein [Bacillus mycoides]